MIPDNVEKIIMTKEDYDRNVEQLLLEKINAEQEIERLNNLLKETGQTLSEQTTKAITLKSENERLNNIINELVKFMNEDYEYYEKYGYAEQGHAMGQIRRIKNKLQELKGSDLAIPPEVIGTNGVDGGLFDYGDR